MMRGSHPSPYSLTLLLIFAASTVAANPSLPTRPNLLNDLIRNFVSQLHPDHSLSSANEGARQLTQQYSKSGSVRPLIYIYDMPEKYHNWTEFGDISDSFYGLDQLFPQLLRASPHWTNNTNEADFFYVDVWMYWPTQDVRSVIQDLQALGPFWDRKGGADHIFTITDDQGRCGKPAEEARKAVFLHHYGRLQRAFHGWFHCNMEEKWGAECDMEMIAAEAAISQRPVTAHDMCHIPFQDIVVPPTCYEPHPSKDFTQHFKTPYMHDELKGMERKDILFYSGKIDLDEGKPDAHDSYWRDAGYSFGARQTLFRMFNRTPGFAILDHHTRDSYWQRLSSSVFCLAAAGWGWGGRMKVSATRGCIPVIVQDGVLVEFEEQLPLKDYAIRIPMWLVHKTPDILHAFINTGRVVKMQKVLECTWKLHWWRRAEGRAFEVVMCELKRRLLGAGKITLDTAACTLDCGDGKLVHLNSNNVNGV